MAYTQAQLEALENAYAQGALKVKWPGGEVEYRNLDDMKRIITDIRASLGRVPSDGGNSYPTYDKGVR